MFPRPSRASHRAAPGTGRVRFHALLGGFTTLVLAALVLGPPARAERPAPVSRLSAAQAAAAGQAITLRERAETPAAHLVVATLPDVAAPDQPPSIAARRLLDIAPELGMVAVTDLVADASATLTVQAADGSQLLVGLPGVRAAEIAADGAWVAALDGAGRLLRVQVADGAVRELAAGPFLGPLLFDADGSLLLLAVSSVEAPWQSRLVRLDPASGASVALSGDELVYAPLALADGIAYAAHDRASGATVVRRLAPTGPQQVADLGPEAIEVDMARDGSALAYEVVGDGAYVLDLATGRHRRVGAGSAPRLSPDGTLLVVRRGRAAAVIDRDGELRDEIASATVAWATCDEECAP